MNKPSAPPVADHDIGPLDEHGQQIWSPEEEAAIARLHADPQTAIDIAEAEADIAAGRVLSLEESRASFAAMRQQWLAERGLA